jgi:phage terminase large subunit-like protein
MAELLDDVPGALWTRANIDANRVKPDDIRWDKIARIVVGVDPAVTSNPDSDETGIVVCALTYSRHVLVLADRSLRASSDRWARAAIDAYRYFRADRIIGEVNQGGDLIEASLRNIDPMVSYRGVRATRGKVIRAEPVAALYEQGRVHHAGPGLEDLEDQLCTWSPQAGMPSPDRMDALVWAITELLVDNSPGVMGVQLTEPYLIG